jgi:hypothetical protein
LADSDIHSFEWQHRITLPAEYRQFLEHFSYCCRALKGSLNQAFASCAVSSGSSSAMA